MTDQAKKRIVLLLADLPAVSAATFAAGAIAGLTFYIINYGLKTPEMFGWVGLSVLFGTMGLVTGSVAGLVTMATDVIGNQPLVRSLARMIATGSVFGILAVAGCLWINPQDTDVVAACVSGAVLTVASVIVAGVRMKHWSRTSPMHGTS